MKLCNVISILILLSLESFSIRFVLERIFRFENCGDFPLPNTFQISRPIGECINGIKVFCTHAEFWSEADCTGSLLLNLNVPRGCTDGTSFVCDEVGDIIRIPLSGFSTFFGRVNVCENEFSHSSLSPVRSFFVTVDSNNTVFLKSFTGGGCTTLANQANFTLGVNNVQFVTAAVDEIGDPTQLDVFDVLHIATGITIGVVVLFSLGFVFFMRYRQLQKQKTQVVGGVILGSYTSAPGPFYNQPRPTTAAMPTVIATTPPPTQLNV